MKFSERFFIKIVWCFRRQIFRRPTYHIRKGHSLVTYYLRCQTLRAFKTKKEKDFGVAPRIASSSKSWEVCWFRNIVKALTYFLPSHKEVCDIKANEFLKEVCVSWKRRWAGYIPR